MKAHTSRKRGCWAILRQLLPKAGFKMRLDYRHGDKGSRLLIRRAHRIELHLSALDSELSCVTMLAGPDQGLPDLCRQQGPFHSRAQAQAAINAIANELIRLRYQRCKAPLIWQLPAQALVRQNRDQRRLHRVDTRFVPLGQLPHQE